MQRIQYAILIIVIFTAFLLSACASTKMQLYSGKSLPASETARLHRFAGERRDQASDQCLLIIRIKEFDFVKPSVSYETLEFLPGSHAVSVDFQPLDEGVSPMSPTTIRFDAEAGGEYAFGCGVNYRSKEWWVWVIEQITGERVSY